MQKIKKTLAVFIAVLMVALSFPITSFALTSGDFEFTLTGEGGALITGYSGTAVNVDIPAVLTTSDGNKYEVQSVNMDIFDSVNIEKISVPKTVRAMENIFRLNRYHTSLARIDAFCSIKRRAFFIVIPTRAQQRFIPYQARLKTFSPARFTEQ